MLRVAARHLRGGDRLVQLQLQRDRAAARAGDEEARGALALCSTLLLPHAAFATPDLDLTARSPSTHSISPPPKKKTQNDVITLNKRFALDHQVKLAISHALAQSSKLAVYEQRLQGIVHSTAHLPEQLASTGKVGISSKQIARLIGQVFLQRSAVNLLSSIMDTPDFFCEPRAGERGGHSAAEFGSHLV